MIRASFKGRIEFDIQAWSSAYYANMVELWKTCIQAFVEAIMISNVIRLETGMSRASLLPLARAVDLHYQIIGQPAAYRGWTGPVGGYHRGQPKSPELGIHLGEKAFNVDYGLGGNFPLTEGVRYAGLTGEMFFSYRIRVFQYRLYENGYRGIGPWNTMIIGKAAFKSAFKDQRGRLFPNLSDHVTRSR